MKFSKKVILIGVFGIFIFSSFLIQPIRAQEWTYDGVNTTNIPGSSVYPSEWYVYEPKEAGPPPGWAYLFEIVKGNNTIQPLIGNSTSVWGDVWGLELSTGNKTLGALDINFGNWNETFGYFYSSSISPLPFIIPVENNGIVSLSILNKVSAFYEFALAPSEYEHHQVYPNIHSIGFWNSSNYAFYHLNYTERGILNHRRVYTPSTMPTAGGNFSLYSQPAQLPPSFSFTTESGSLNFNTTDFKLNITINDADNNNDQEIDTDYLYRIRNGTTWTDWAVPPSQLDWDLGSVPTGNYDIAVEVKNMYGVTQKEITIQYTAPSGNGGNGGTPTIPGYSMVLLSIALMIGISFLLQKNRKKL